MVRQRPKHPPPLVPRAGSPVKKNVKRLHTTTEWQLASANSSADLDRRWHDLAIATRPLRSSEFDDAHAAFRRVFASGDPFGTPFLDSTDRRVLMFPVDMSLDESTFLAVIQAARAVGEDEAYLVDVERWGEIELEDERRHRWLIDLTDHTTYSAPPDAYFPICETALVSKNGTWGLLISHANHGVAGSRDAFVPSLARGLKSSRDDMAIAWLAHWIDLRGRIWAESPDNWLPAHLAHVYGEEEAQHMLETAGWFHGGARI